MYRKLVSALFYRFESENNIIRLKKLLHFFEFTPFTLFLLGKLAYKGKRISDKRLAVTVARITFDNPVMVAAGWDKYGETVQALYQFGFSSVEVGSVVTYPQVGNPKPRLFMIAHGVLLNHFGFNSPGLEVVAKNVEKYKNTTIPIGINIGKNKYIPNHVAPELYAIAIRRFYEYGAYFVINISSPNTKDLRKLQQKKILTQIIKEILLVMGKIGGEKPLFIKISPEISQKFLDEIIEIVIKHKLAGIIATNTTTNAHLKAKYGQDWEERLGGISGDDPHYRRKATMQVAYIYRKTHGKIAIIGVGGINDAATAIERIKAGATMVQILTALYTEGPSLPGRINAGILDYMNQHKIKKVIDLVGIESNKWV